MHVVGRAYAVRCTHIYPTCADIHIRGVRWNPGVRRKNRSNTILTHRTRIYLYIPQIEMCFRKSHFVYSPTICKKEIFKKFTVSTTIYTPGFIVTPPNIFFPSCAFSLVSRKIVRIFTR